MTRRAARSAAATAPATTTAASTAVARTGSPSVPRGRRAARAVPDATIEPDPGPPPEAVFDRLTGPYVRHAGVATPGMRGSEDA